MNSTHQHTARDARESSEVHCLPPGLAVLPHGERDEHPVPSPAFSRETIAHIFLEVLKNSLFRTL